AANDLDERDVSNKGRRHGLFADVGQQRHKARSLHGRADRSLERGANAAPLPAEEPSLPGAELLEPLDILVIHKRRPWTPLRRAHPAPILAALAHFLPYHPSPRLCELAFGEFVIRD